MASPITHNCQVLHISMKSVWRSKLLTSAHGTGLERGTGWNGERGGPGDWNGGRVIVPLFWNRGHPHSNKQIWCRTAGVRGFWPYGLGGNRSALTTIVSDHASKACAWRKLIYADFNF